jgi:hypothetical protein
MGRYEDLKFFVAPKILFGDVMKFIHSTGRRFVFATHNVRAHLKLEFAYAKRIDLYSERND